MEKKERTMMMIFMMKLIEIIFQVVKMIKVKKKDIIQMLLEEVIKEIRMIFTMRLIKIIYLVVKMIKVEKEYDILNILGFTSERKRMSIIVKEKDSDIIKIYTKGADCEISNRLSKKSKESESFEIISNGLLEFSKQGFRTLMVAYRKISKKEYELCQRFLIL